MCKTICHSYTLMHTFEKCILHCVRYMYIPDASFHYTSHTHTRSYKVKVAHPQEKYITHKGTSSVCLVFIWPGEVCAQIVQCVLIKTRETFKHKQKRTPYFAIFADRRRRTRDSYVCGGIYAAVALFRYRRWVIKTEQFTSAESYTFLVVHTYIDTYIVYVCTSCGCLLIRTTKGVVTTAADTTSLPTQWPVGKHHHQFAAVSAEDSGCISSASADLASAELSCPIDSSDRISDSDVEKTTLSSGVDSGLCHTNDIDDDNDNNASMHVDTKAGAKEWACSALLIDNCNNLSKAAPPPPTVGSTAQSLSSINPMVLKEYMSLWRVCYIQDEFGDTQLHLSILSKMSKAITNIIRIAPQKELYDLRNDDGQCGMHLAVTTSQPDVIRQLRTFGAETCIRDFSGNTPLHLACINNDLSCVQALTDPMGCDDLKQFPRAETVRNYNGEYCVHIAARFGHIDILRQLVHACNVNLNEREGHSGDTPLHIACHSKNTALIQFLLAECQGKVNPETRNYGRRTAFKFAQLQNDGVVMQALASSGATPMEMSSSSSSDDEEEDTDEDYDDEMSMGTPVACV